MRLSIFLAFLFYLGTVASTQTAHGGRFLTLRWVALAILAGISLIFWVSKQIPRKDQMGNRGAPHFTIIYLLATLLSVGIANNYAYSGLRWLSHAMLLITFMYLLRGLFNFQTTKQIIWVLKGVTSALLLISFFYPAPPSVYDNPYFRGAMGDSNSLGHVATICALFFLHGAITSAKPMWRLFQFSAAIVAAGILVFTWARSSMIAFLIGLVLLNYYYGLTRSYISKAFALLAVCFLIASPWIQTGLMDFVAKDREEKGEKQTSQILAIIKGDIFKGGPTFEKVIETRSFLWSEAWEGFKQKPFLGWGFGANQDVESEWSIRPTSGGMVRDLTNDILFTLEGSGIIGFLAYIGLVISIFIQSLTKQQVIRIKGTRSASLMALIKSNRGAQANKKELEIYKRGMISTPAQHEGKKLEHTHLLARDNQQAILYILSVSLFFLFLTDGSAFSAGSLISAIFWVCAGAAGALRAEAVVAERLNNRVEERGQSPLKERPSASRSASLEERAKGA